MTDHGYTASQDPYCYPNSTVLRNKLGFRTQAELDNHEALATASRFADPFPEGNFDITHYRAIPNIFSKMFSTGRVNIEQCASAKAEACFATRNTSKAN
jgi:cell filamentation protein